MSPAIPGLQAVERRSLSDEVFEQLRGQILSGRLVAGSALPSERELCEQLGVNRGAVREALKRLQQLRLVAIRQGDSTRVLDYRQTGGLDLLAAILFEPDGDLSLPVARSLVEMRGALGPDIARRAADRRTDAHLRALDTVMEQMRDCAHDDAVSLEAASFELWRVMVRASDNVAYQLAFNTLEGVWQRVRGALAPTLMPELTERQGYERLAQAIHERDGERAREVAARLVTRGTNAVLDLVAQWENPT